MKTYSFENEIYCLVYKDEDWVKGLNFITPDHYYIQAGSWWYDKGKELDAHKHNTFPRESLRTQESVYIKSGSMLVRLFTDDGIFLEDFILHEGDLAVFVSGGHGYSILEDNTKVIETKNGPFTGVENDKVRF